jgi:undecaprenyl-diphosphatase
LSEPESSQQARRVWPGFSVRLAAGWVLLFVGCLALGWLVVDGFASTSIGSWDRALPQEWEDARTASMNSWTQLGSAAADTLFVIAVATFVGALLLFLKRWVSTLFLVCALLLEVTVFSLTALIIGRDRPDVEQLDVSPPTSSFPSGHTAAATALYVGLTLIAWWNFKSRAAVIVASVVATLAVLSVGLSRIYRGMHHPTDVFAGVLLGVGCVLFAYFAVRAWVGGDPSESTEDMEPVPAAEEIR